MEKEKKNKGLIAIVIVLILVIIGLIVYICYDKEIIRNTKKEEMAEKSGSSGLNDFLTPKIPFIPRDSLTGMKGIFYI